MTQADKITTLVDLLEGGNAKLFAEKCGIRPDVLSRAKKSKGSVSRTVVPRILSAYPNVRKEWIIYGTGDPLTEMPAPKPTDIKALTESINALTAVLKKILSKMNQPTG